ncbi:MAG: fumarate reductase subunit D [Candidatus Dadabacteria bacterium]|nr:fumarate reductase subunit D [Candidatus Dadabacteria bacterium]
MSKSNEPIWWSLFAAGGAISAFFVPILIVIIGFVLPFGLAGDEPFVYERIRSAVSHPVIKLLLFFLIALTFFIWAHRFLFTLVHMGLHNARSVISVFCYGSAIIGSILTAITLWRI